MFLLDNVQKLKTDNKNIAKFEEKKNNKAELSKTMESSRHTQKTKVTISSTQNLFLKAFNRNTGVSKSAFKKTNNNELRRFINIS